MTLRTRLARGLDLAARLTAPERQPPAHVREWLARSRETARTPGMTELVQEPRASMQAWRETLYATIADGAAVATAVKTILVPDFTLPAAYLYPGRVLKYQLWGRLSTVITTPGTWTHTLNWGGSGGTVVATSGAWAPDPTAAATNLAWWVEYVMVCRSIGTSGSAFTMGRLWHNDVDDGAAAVANLTAALNNQSMAFPDVPAAVTIDTTTAKAISPCVTPNVATGSMTCHIGILEALT